MWGGEAGEAGEAVGWRTIPLASAATGSARSRVDTSTPTEAACTGGASGKETFCPAAGREGGTQSCGGHGSWHGAATEPVMHEELARHQPQPGSRRQLCSLCAPASQGARGRGWYATGF